MASSLETTMGLEAGHRLSHPEPGEEIVISGLSGSYPESANVYEFQDNLFNKIDMITSDTRRWDFDNPEFVKFSGKIPDIDTFDVAFFGIQKSHVHGFDVSGRLVLEKAVEAILDAGVSLEEIKGTKTAVFMAVCFLENQLSSWFTEPIIDAIYG